MKGNVGKHRWKILIEPNKSRKNRKRNKLLSRFMLPFVIFVFRNEVWRDFSTLFTRDEFRQTFTGDFAASENFINEFTGFQWYFYVALR